MCRNGLYTEHGIKGRHGFARQFYRSTPEFVVRVDPAVAQVGVLLEPTTVVAKAWDHIERIGKRARWEPSRVLVTGAGPIGLLAALMSVQRGLETHVVDLSTGSPRVPSRNSPAPRRWSWTCSPGPATTASSA
jgi:glucose 1-dehydrogenase